ncbi:MAG: TolC family protein, partial [Alphaproteobacteria bacterium]|nr:TolC family protein [Alphaproteobacteria bacterium]
MRKYILLFISTLLGTSSAIAQTLFDTLANTYETNPTLKASQAYLRSVDERVGQAKSGWRPYIVAQGNISHSDQTFKNYPGLSEDVDYENDAYDAGVVMTQNVFQGFKTWNAVDYAQTIVLQERESVRSTEQNVLLDAATAYVNVIRDRAVLELQKNQEQVLARHLKSYKKRFQVGDLTKTDVAQAEARLEGAKANRILADGNLETSIAAYACVVGNKPDTHMEINDFTKL